jgi:hypothetical protein
MKVNILKGGSTSDVDEEKEKGEGTKKSNRDMNKSKYIIYMFGNVIMKLLTLDN